MPTVLWVLSCGDAVSARPSALCASDRDGPPLTASGRRRVPTECQRAMHWPFAMPTIYPAAARSTAPTVIRDPIRQSGPARTKRITRPSNSPNKRSTNRIPHTIWDARLSGWILPVVVTRLPGDGQPGTEPGRFRRGSGLGTHADWMICAPRCLALCAQRALGAGASTSGADSSHSCFWV
jgi:hypothetical protein